MQSLNPSSNSIAIDRRTAVDFIEPELDVRNASLSYIRVLEEFATRVADGLKTGDIRSANTAFWGSAYGLGLSCCEEISMTQRASFMGVTRATISKSAQSFVTDMGLSPSFYMKSAESHKPYAMARKEYIANGCRPKFKIK